MTQNEKSFLLQKQVRENSEDLQNEFLDLKNWEEQMRRKDEELRKEAGGEVVLPPIRRKDTKQKVKKSKITEIKEKEGKKDETKSKRIKSSDYSSWEKFDVEKACKEIDKEEESDDSDGEPMSKEALEKAHDTASKHKQEGNVFVQQGKWDKAIACYTQAIKAFPYDAVFYANRALCHMKLDNLYSAEADCSTAIQLDEIYVKAYYRRATVRMGLKQYREARQDLEKILKLEPSNKEAKPLLEEVKKKLESSKPVVTPQEDVKDEAPIEKKIGEKIWSKAKTTEEKKVKENKSEVERSSDEKKKERDPRIPDWLPEKDDVAVVEPVERPPHLRSKSEKPMRRVPVIEVDFTAMQSETPNDRIPSNKDETVEPKDVTDESSETKKSEEPRKTDVKEKNDIVEEPVETDVVIPPVPRTAVQFLMDWKKNKSPEFRYKYLKQLPQNSLSKVFQDSMESDIITEIIQTLRTEFVEKKEPVYSYLDDLTRVKRFRALIMFIGSAEKEGLKVLFEYCKTVENIDEESVKDLYVKYEI